MGLKVYQLQSHYLDGQAGLGLHFAHDIMVLFPQCTTIIFSGLVHVFYNAELTVLEFNDMSTLVGHFVSTFRERSKRDSRDEREGQGRKRNRNESEETEEIKKHSSSSLTCYKDSRFAQL